MMNRLQRGTERFLIIIIILSMTLNQVQSFRINHQAGSHLYQHIITGQQ